MSGRLTPPLADTGASISLRQRAQSLFTHLVTEGRKVERRERAAMSGRVDRLRRGVSTLATTLGDHLESGCVVLLRRAGVPNRREISELVQRLEELDARLKKLG